MDILYGRLSLEGLAPLPPEATPEQALGRFTRVHQLHRIDPVAERLLLHPRPLDVAEALIGPDLLALQSMLFFSPPGRGGQGWHQDSHYITTYPDALLAAWLALDPVDVGNGCLHVLPGSQHEPVYPDPAVGSQAHAETAFADLVPVQHASDPDDAINALAGVAAGFRATAIELAPGDAVFLHGHLLHRSYPNAARDRWRRAFVGHYCNARCWVPWNHGEPWEGASANHLHILARGASHLGFARPRFGTPCAALEDQLDWAAAHARRRVSQPPGGTASAWDERGPAGS